MIGERGGHLRDISLSPKLIDPFHAADDSSYGPSVLDDALNPPAGARLNGTPNTVSILSIQGGVCTWPHCSGRIVHDHRFAGWMWRLSKLDVYLHIA